MTKGIIVAALITALPSVGSAETWEKAITIYGWLPGLDTSIGTAFGDFEASPSGSDVLSNLDMAFMGTFEVDNGTWGFISDVIYVDLSDTKSTPFGRLFSDGKVDVTTWAVSGYVTYRFHESNSARYEVAGGFRYFDLDTQVALNAGTLAARSQSLDDSWFDPVIGIRGSWKLSDKWSATAFADYGGFSDSSETWQVVGTFNYSFNESLSARIGYRHMDISKTIAGADVDIGLSGPVIGLTYRF